MLKTVTKTVELPISPAVAFTYLATVSNWPQWAIYAVKTAEPQRDGSWKVTSHRGPCRFCMRAETRTGLLDHDFLDSDGNQWAIPARVVAGAVGSVFIRTFSQPQAMPDGVFAQNMRWADEEQARLREVISQRQASYVS